VTVLALETGTIGTSVVDLPYDTSGSVGLDVLIACLLPANRGSQLSSHDTSACRGSRKNACRECVWQRYERVVLHRPSGHMLSRAG
jgi:hypothetical protein